MSGWFFCNSIQHFTTEAQAEDKVAATGTSMQAGQGAFGQPATRTAQDSLGEAINFTAVTTLEVSAYLILDAQYGKLAQFWNADPSTAQCSLEVRADGSLAFYRGEIQTLGGTLIQASAAAVFQFNVQNHIYIRVDFSNSTGKVVLAVNGTTVIDSAANKDTCASAADETCSQLRLFSAGSTNFASGYWSHYALADTAGTVNNLQPRVSAMFPTADGSDETGAQTGGAAGDAYSVVDETSPDDTDYLEHDAGERNSFVFGTPPANLAAVLGVQSVARVFKTDADVVTARPYVSIGGTRYYGDTVGVPADVAYLTYLWNENPATTSAWTPSDITAPIEAGWERVA